MQRGRYVAFHFSDICCDQLILTPETSNRGSGLDTYKVHDPGILVLEIVHRARNVVLFLRP